MQGIIGNVPSKQLHCHHAGIVLHFFEQVRCLADGMQISSHMLCCTGGYRERVFGLQRFNSNVLTMFRAPPRQIPRMGVEPSLVSLEREFIEMCAYLKRSTRLYHPSDKDAQFS